MVGALVPALSAEPNEPWPTAPMPTTAGTLRSTCCTVWAPVFWMSCCPTAITLAPTGATPRMLVPVTTISSTWLASAAWAAKAYEAPRATRPAIDALLNRRTTNWDPLRWWRLVIRFPLMSSTSVLVRSLANEGFGGRHGSPLTLAVQ